MNGYWPAISVAGHEIANASAGHHWPRRTGTLWTMPANSAVPAARLASTTVPMPATAAIG